MHQEENADEESDSEDQMKTADKLVYWGPNHQPELQEAEASHTTSTQYACIILVWTTPDNEIIYNIVVIVVLLIFSKYVNHKNRDSPTLNSPTNAHMEKVSEKTLGDSCCIYCNTFSQMKSLLIGINRTAHQ